MNLLRNGTMELEQKEFSTGIQHMQRNILLATSYSAVQENSDFGKDNHRLLGNMWKIWIKWN